MQCAGLRRGDHVGGSAGALRFRDLDLARDAERVFRPLDGVELPVRPNLGIYTQPISFVGLPVVAVPVPLDPLPIAVQIIAGPWREDVALAIAHALEVAGIAAAPRPNG